MEVGCLDGSVVFATGAVFIKLALGKRMWWHYNKQMTNKKGMLPIHSCNGDYGGLSC